MLILPHAHTHADACGVAHGMLLSAARATFDTCERCIACCGTGKDESCGGGPRPLGLDVCAECAGFGWRVRTCGGRDWLRIIAR